MASGLNACTRWTLPRSMHTKNPTRGTRRRRRAANRWVPLTASRFPSAGAHAALRPGAEQRRRGAGGDAAARRWDGAGHPRQRAHLEDHAAAAQLRQGRRGAEGIEETSGGFMASLSLCWSPCQFYAFSTFALHLNELHRSMEGVIPLTDSRLRPDIRAMEMGDIGTVRPRCWCLGVSMPWFRRVWWFILQTWRAPRRKDWRKSKEPPGKTALNLQKSGKQGESLPRTKSRRRLFLPFNFKWTPLCCLLSPTVPSPFWHLRRNAALGARSGSKLCFSLLWCEELHSSALFWAKCVQCVVTLSTFVTLFRPNDSIFVLAVCFYFCFVFLRHCDGSPVNFLLIFFSSDYFLSCRWFQQGANPHNKAQDWLYLKGYWDRKYTQLPDIY